MLRKGERPERGHECARLFPWTRFQLLFATHRLRDFRAAYSHHQSSGTISPPLCRPLCPSLFLKRRRRRV